MSLLERSQHLKKAQKDIKIYECRMEVLDGSPFKTMMNKVGRKIKKLFSKQEK